MADSPVPAPAAAVPAAATQPLISVDGAMLAAGGKGLLSLLLGILQYVIMGLTSGYTTGQVLKAGVTQELQNVPPILKRLMPPPIKTEDAIGRIVFGKSGCTATVMGPVMTNDESIEILTAAHCVKLNSVGRMTLSDGRSFAVKCVARDEQSDVAWLVANNPGGDVPYLILADDSPAPGSQVWHQGYGVHVPRNREVGSFQGVTQNGLQCSYKLNVSHGDSGGAIVLNDDGRVLSPVCCTMKVNVPSTVWGATPQSCAAIRPSRTRTSSPEVVTYPVLPIPSGEWPGAV